MKYIFFEYSLSLAELVEGGYGPLIREGSYLVEERKTSLKETVREAQKWMGKLSSILEQHEKPGGFFDAEFMSAQEKRKIWQSWRRFVLSGFRQDKFTRTIYQHLHLHCGFIAHYNISGFYSTYFSPYSLLPGVSYKKKLLLQILLPKVVGLLLAASTGERR